MSIDLPQNTEEEEDKEAPQPLSTKSLGADSSNVTENGHDQAVVTEGDESAAGESTMASSVQQSDEGGASKKKNKKRNKKGRR